MKVEPSLVVQIRKANPCATLREIGAQVGVSYQRVRQILAAEGVPTTAVRVYKHVCPLCGKRLARHPKRGVCRTCYNKAWMYADLPCVECGATVHKSVAVITNNARHGGQGRVFCNRHCYGKWFGKHFGFGPHPENQRLGHLTRAARRRKVAEAES